MRSGPVQVRVLVADDHPMFRASLSRVVSLHPELTLVGEANDGRQALEAIRASVPDVAVVDLRMPGLDGMQILEAVNAEGLATRVVLLSGHLQDEAIYQALQSGAAAVLTKVAEGSSVTDAVLAVARGETFIAPEVQQAVAKQIQLRGVGGQPALTRREHDVLSHVASGRSVAAIAEELHLSPSTIKTHLEHLYRKLGVSDRAAAVAEAMRRGILY